MNYYQCKKGCHVSNKSGRCPRCGEWMIDCGTDLGKITDEIKARQLSYAGNVPEILNNRNVQIIKEKFKREEAAYFNKLRKK